MEAIKTKGASQAISSSRKKSNWGKQQQVGSNTGDSSYIGGR